MPGMYSFTTYNGLTSEANYDPTQPGTGYAADMARHSLQVRREMWEAARVLNPGNLRDTIVTQHATVVTNALANAVG